MSLKRLDKKKLFHPVRFSVGKYHKEGGQYTALSSESIHKKKTELCAFLQSDNLTA